MSKKAVTTTAAALAVIALIVGIAIGAALAPSLGLVPPAEKVVEEKIVEVPPLRGEILIGALLPLTGDLASYGENSQQAALLAESEVNDFLKKSGQPFTIKVLVEDTQTKPDVALQKLQSLAARGVKLYVGPQSSGEIRQIKSYVDANKLLLVSQSSTAPDLAISGDFVFRICPDDTIQGPIGPKLFKGIGVTHMIYAYRGDAWGDGLFRTSAAEARSLGINIGEEIRYAPEKKEFSAEAKALSDAVKEAMAAGVAPANIGVQLIAFGEAVAFLVSAADYPDLAKVRWFGSDGTAQLAELTKEPKAAKFGADVKWVNPIFAPAFNEKYTKVTEFTKQKLGRAPDSYAYSAYDIVWLLSLTLMQVQKYDGEAMRNVFFDVASRYYGAVGWTRLNEAGDLASADYLLWVLLPKDGTFDWADVGTFSFSTGGFVWKPGFSL